MPHDDRVPPSASHPSPRQIHSPPFCRVERRDAGGTTRHYVVHTESPKFLVEFDRATPSAAGAGTGGPTQPGQAKVRERPVIRRVCVPNSWAGDYHLCARKLGAAADFFAATETRET
jgi:hypothetical protein